MHVLFISTRSPYPLSGRHATRTYHWLRDVARRHYVTFLTFIQREEEWDGLPTLKKFCDDVIGMPVPAYSSRLAFARELTANLFSARPILAQRYDTRAMHNAIRSAESEIPIDLMHLDSVPLAVYARSAGSAPVVLADHDVEHVRMEAWAKGTSGLSRRFRRGQAARMKMFETAAANRATCTIAGSRGAAATLQALVPGADIRTLPEGVDTDHFQPAGGAVEAREVALLGSPSPAGLDAVRSFLDEAWPRIKAARPDARLTVLGVESLPSQPDGVIVPGPRADDRLSLGPAAVCVAPFRTGEGALPAILEAMAMGKAVVATQAACAEFSMADNNEVALADDGECFATRTIELMDNAELRDRIGAAARAAVEQRHTWERVGEGLEAIYQDLHRKHRKRLAEPPPDS